MSRQPQCGSARNVAVPGAPTGHLTWAQAAESACVVALPCGPVRGGQPGYDLSAAVSAVVHQYMRSVTARRARSPGQAMFALASCCRACAILVAATCPRADSSDVCMVDSMSASCGSVSRDATVYDRHPALAVSAPRASGSDWSACGLSESRVSLLTTCMHA